MSSRMYDMTSRIPDLVSIVMPAYKAERFIAEAVASVRAQTYPQWELLIVDDCSPDGTWAEAERLAALDSRIRCQRTPKNVGAAGARNLALDLSRGQYIAFLDADDRWSPDKLEKQLRYMRENNAAIVCSGYEKMDENGLCAGRQVIPPLRAGYSDLLRTCSMGCLTVVYDAARTGLQHFPELHSNPRHLARRLGIVGERLGSEDYACWLMLLGRQQGSSAVVHGQQEVLAAYRVVQGSLSGNKLRSAAFQWHVYRRVLGMGRLRSLWYMGSYAWHGYRKYRI